MNLKTFFLLKKLKKIKKMTGKNAVRNFLSMDNSLFSELLRIKMDDPENQYRFLKKVMEEEVKIK